MRPPLPPPGFLRAVPGFIVGAALMVIVIAVLRALVFGMLGPADIPGFLFSTAPTRVFMGDWINDQAMMMWAAMGGALGFIWGVGGILDTPLDVHQEARALAVTENKPRQRIPSDPDAPKDTRNPLTQLTGIAPNLLILVAVLVITVLAITLLPRIAPTQRQLSNESATVDDFGKGDFNLLGLVKFEDVDQGVLFAGFAAIVVLLILGLPMGLALGLYVLNRQVKEAAAAPADPNQGERFFPIRLIGFFNQWVLDAIESSTSIIRPR